MGKEDQAVARRTLKNRPLIGVTGPVKRGWTAWIFASYALRLAGARTCRLTPASSSPPEPLDGLVIGGGDDIDPERYDQVARLSIRLDRERDALEWEMLEQAAQGDIPVLGICRGAQLLNIFYGGSLHHDLMDVFENLVLRRTVLPRKRIDIDSTTRLAEIMGVTEVRVNSLHHQAVDRLATDFQIAAKDDDGIIQAIENTQRRFMIGVQWHPEYLPQSRPHQRIFSELVQAAATLRLRRS